ncbi:MAG: hypothetical protein CMN77_16550 [Spirochaetaceae bacterium]|nr:hypothetical protein [Spirochaetaceae bacterium]|tara:strand:- start:53767 stop:55386 length:1620 start_codon:yes stop_codon:yes gene_type:complete
MGSWRSYISLSSIALVIFSLVTLFLFHAMSGIMDLKFMELKQAMERERIMNLELSSRALRNRNQIRLESSGLQRELMRNMLESRVLNSRAEEEEEHGLPLTALLVTNGVRMLTFKEPLQIEADREKLMALKLAFFFERSRKYNQALKIYNRLDPRDFPDPFPAFLKLHTGFCYLAMGKWEDARTDLELVVVQYPATHYERAARFLLELLDRHQRAERMQAQNPLERADAMFAAGNCPATVDALNRARKQSPLSPYYLYRLALCLEETGDLQEATDIFNQLAGTAGPFARQANRRLLMIGHFYGGSPELKQDAEKRAVALGDTEVVKEVRQTAEVTRKPHVVEEIRQWKEQPENKEGIMHEVLSDPSPSFQRDLQAMQIQLDPGGEDDSGNEGTGEESIDPEGQESKQTAESTEDKNDASMDARQRKLNALLGVRSSEDTDQYEMARPAVHRWPARFSDGVDSTKFILLTQRVRRQFETEDGESYDLEGKTVVSHASGILLLRLRDNRSFLIRRAKIQNGNLVTDRITVSLDLVYQIAAY